MLHTNELYNKKLFITDKKGRVKKHGNLRSVVFHPSKPRAVGVIVKRPDALMMVQRKDRFVAFDAITVDEEGRYVVDLQDTGAWDKGACKRLDVSFDDCIIWVGMPVQNIDGQELGTISNVTLDDKTFQIVSIDISKDAAARAILGSADITADKIKGYKDGAIVVEATAADVTVSGGAAAKAGEAWAKGSHAAKEAGSKATAAAGEAVNKGARKTGEALGAASVKLDEVRAKLAADDDDDDVEYHVEDDEADEQAGASGKAAKAVGQQLGRFGSMFSDFKDEFDKASKGE